MDIKFYFFEGCPSHETALQRLRDQLSDFSVDTPVEVIQVETEAAAEQHAFVGSPTIRINGQDIDPTPIGAQFALTCRPYRTEDGRITPLPSVKMIRTALEAHLA